MAASAVLAELMTRARLAANTITYTAAIRACKEGGQWQIVLNLLSLMAVAANTISYSAAISACEKGDQVFQHIASQRSDFRGRAAVSSMPQAKLEPSSGCKLYKLLEGSGLLLALTTHVQCYTSKHV